MHTLAAPTTDAEMPSWLAVQPEAGIHEHEAAIHTHLALEAGMMLEKARARPA